MPAPRFWPRLRESRLVQVLLVYLGASWLAVQIVGDLQDMLQLPAWIGPVTLILLGVGLLIMLATAWVQSHPAAAARAASEEIPSSWELDLPDAVRAVKAGRLPHLTWSRALAAGAVAFCLLFGAAGVYVVLRSDVDVFGPATVSADVAPDGIAVLPFTVRGGNIDEWREGMVDLLSTGLDGAGGVRAIASRTVLARWHDVIPDSIDADQNAALDVARDVGARYALIGSAVAIGPSVRLTVDVHELEPGRTVHLGQAQVEGAPDSVLVLVDRLGMETLGLIFRAAGADLPRVDLASVTTASLPALKSYLKGEATYRTGDFGLAAEEYERAIAADSLFALAHWRLSQALGWNESIASVRARDAHERAIELADRLPAREALIVRASVHTRNNDPAGIPLLQQAVQRYPDDAEAWYQLGDAYLHVTGARVGWEEARDAFERAITIAPRMAPYHIHLLEATLRHDADTVALRERLEAFGQIAPNSTHIRRFTLARELAFADSATADSLLRDAVPELAASNMGAQIATSLSHPQFTEQSIAFGQWAYDRAPAQVRRQIVRGEAMARIIARGQMRAGLEALDDPTIPDFGRHMIPLQLHLSGLPVPAERLRAALAFESGALDYHTFLRAAYAASVGDWPRYNELRPLANQLRDSLRAAGDTAGAREITGGMGVLDAYALWRRGNADEARVTIEEALKLNSQDELTIWWAGMLNFETGRLKEAEPYFRSFSRWSPDPRASYYLGRIYEQTRRPEQAREMFAFLVAQWAHADPELQPLVGDARQRLIALDPERRSP